MRLILKVIIGAVATAVAVWLVPGITLTADSDQDKVLTLLGVAAILGLVDGFVRPLARFAGFCLIVLTLGLFLFVINAAMLLLVSWISGQVGLGFHVDGFWPAVFGSIIITVASSILAGALGVES